MSLNQRLFIGAILGAALNLQACAELNTTGTSTPGEAAPKLGLSAYTSAHANVALPQGLLGGPVTVSVIQQAGKTRLVLPGPRMIDSSVFGTPSRPGVYDPLLGDVTKFGLVSGDHYSITNRATPFSNWAFAGTGSMRMRVVDATAIDAATTRDKIDFEAHFQLPDGASYRVIVKKALAHGLDHPVFGGVATNMLLHGATGVGTALMPSEFMYAGFWGLGDIYRNDKLINKDHLVHVMLTEIVRDNEFRLREEGSPQRDPNGRVVHLMIPPFKPVPGRGMVADPLKTRFMPFPYVKKAMQGSMKKIASMPQSAQKQAMMDAMAQAKDVMAKTKAHVIEATQAGKMFGMPFIHIMFESVDVTASHA